MREFKIPCCQPETPENIEKNLRLIEEHKEETGEEYLLINNLGGMLEVVPKKSLEFIKLVIPNLKIHGNQ